MYIEYYINSIDDKELDIKSIIPAASFLKFGFC